MPLPSCQNTSSSKTFEFCLIIFLCWRKKIMNSICQKLTGWCWKKVRRQSIMKQTEKVISYILYHFIILSQCCYHLSTPSILTHAWMKHEVERHVETFDVCFQPWSKHQRNTCNWYLCYCAVYVSYAASGDVTHLWFAAQICNVRTHVMFKYRLHCLEIYSEGIMYFIYWLISFSLYLIVSTVLLQLVLIHVLFDSSPQAQVGWGNKLCRCS